MLSNINKIYVTHDKSRISQGDIIRDVIYFTKINGKEVKIEFPFAVVVSQDCDLESVNYKIKEINEIDFFSDNYKRISQPLPNILLLPAFLYESVINNTYLEVPYKITTSRSWTDSDKEEIKKNSISERYHYLPQTLDLEMQDLVIDFKCYISMPIQELINQHNDNYFCTLNELFRERLSQRFASYFTRIGLPVIEYDYFITTQEDFESKKQRSDISNGIYCVFVDNSNEDDFKVYRVKDLQIKELTVSGQKALKKKYIKREFINIRISSSDAEKLFTNIY